MGATTRGVEAAAKAAGLGKVTPKDLRASLCSLSGRRGVDPIEAAQITGHSLAVWTKHYARSFGKPQRDEARAACSSTASARRRSASGARYERAPD
jgi:integrase